MVKAGVCLAIFLLHASAYGAIRNEYKFTILGGPFVSQPFTVSSYGACITNYCALSGVAAVSYSRYYSLCIVVKCPNAMKLVRDMYWETATCVSPVFPCFGTRGQYEWMMTSSCGFNNSGTVGAGPMLIGRAGSNQSLLPYEQVQSNLGNRTSQSSSMGSSPVLQANGSYYFEASIDNLTLNLSSTSMSIYTQFYIDQVKPFTLVSIGYKQGDSFTSQLSISFAYSTRNDGNWTMTIDSKMGRCGNNTCIVSADFPILLNKWHQMLLVSKSVINSGNITNSFMITSSFFGFTILNSTVDGFNTATINAIVVGGRPGAKSNGANDQLIGSVSCLKVYFPAFTTTYTSIAASCMNGQFGSVY